MSEYVLRNCGSLMDQVHINQYLVAFDPEAHRGLGVATWTPNVSEARKFPTFQEAMECWRQQSKVRPLRDDGKPNRPLTAYSVEPVPLDEHGQPQHPPLLPDPA